MVCASETTGPCSRGRWKSSTRVGCTATRALAATSSACSSRMMAARSGATTRSGTVGGAMVGGEACRRVMASRRVRAGGGALAGALGGEVLSVAGAVDIDANGVHGKAVEDRRGERGVSQKASPVAEGNIRGDRRGDLAVTAIDEIVERVSGGGAVARLPALTHTDVAGECE